MTVVNWIILWGGIHATGFAVFHCFFWRIFKWKTDLASISVANRAIVQISNLRLIYFFLFVAFICFNFSTELVNTSLGRVFLGGVSLFWLGRLLEQFIFLRLNHTMVHVLTIFFIIGVILFALPLFL